ncbi:MAG: ATP-binding protein, partial [Pseudomonadota bacterium]
RLQVWGSEESRVERRFLKNGRILDIYRSLSLDGDIISVHVDVTEAVRSEQVIERQRLYMASLLENMSDGLALLDADGCFVMFNEQFLELYDVDPDKVYWGIDYDSLLAHMGDLQQLPKAQFLAELKLRREFAFDPGITNAQRRLRNGRTLNINKTNLPGGGCVMTTRDISQQLQREEELTTARIQAEESARSKSEFVARMSHEMRTPLHGILGVAALLGKSGLERNETDLLKVITTSGEVLLRLIDDILDLSRIDAETFEVIEEEFRIEELIGECFSTVEHAAQDKGIEMLCPSDLGSIPMLRGDTVRIKQILLNLLGNSVKFTEHGQIRVNVEQNAGPEGITLTFAVSDTGVGIAPDQLDQIFDRFYQVDGTATRKHGGAGLGLTITRKIVDAMGGTIQVKSEPGKGTTFYIRLTLEIA